MSSIDGSGYPSPRQLTNRKNGGLHKSSRSMGAISDSGLVVFGNNNNGGDISMHGVYRSMGVPETINGGGGVMGPSVGGGSATGSSHQPIGVHYNPNGMNEAGGLHDTSASPFRPNSVHPPISRPPRSVSSSVGGSGVCGNVQSGDKGNDTSAMFNLNSWEEGGLNRTSKPITRPAASIPVRRDNSVKESTFHSSGVVSPHNDFFGLPEHSLGSAPRIQMSSGVTGVAANEMSNDRHNVSGFSSPSESKVLLQSNMEMPGMSNESGTPDSPHSLKGGGYYPPTPIPSRSQQFSLSGSIAGGNGGRKENFYSTSGQGGVSPARGEPAQQLTSVGFRGHPSQVGLTPPPGLVNPAGRSTSNTWNNNNGMAPSGQEYHNSTMQSSFPPPSGSVDPHLSAFPPASAAGDKGVSSPAPPPGGSGGNVGLVMANSLKRFIWSSAFGAETPNSATAPLPLYQTRFGCPADDLPLMEELGVDVKKIIPKAVSVLNIFQEPGDGLSSCHDLAGPILFAVSIAVLLLLQGKVEFSAVYALMITGVILLRLILPLMSGVPTSLVLVTSALGYGLLPCVFLALVYVAQFWFLGKSHSNSYLYPVAGLFVVWSACGASSLMSSDLKLQHQRYLIFYPCFLFYALFAALTII